MRRTEALQGVRMIKFRSVLERYEASELDQIDAAALLGISAARRLFLKISRDGLLRAVSLMLLASGGSLVWRALG